MFKEFIEAAEQRIKSPLVGSMALSFAVYHWRPLLHLFFSDETIEVRIEAFAANFGNLSAVLGPVIIGILIALASPWIKFFSALIAEAPSRRLKLLQDLSAHRVLTIKNELEVERQRARQVLEDNIVEKAITDQKISEIEDDSIRKEAEKEIESVRMGDSKVPNKIHMISENLTVSQT